MTRKEKVYNWIYVHENEMIPVDDIFCAIIFGLALALAFAAGNEFGSIGVFIVTALAYIGYQKFMVWFMCGYFDYAQYRDEQARSAE